MKTLHALDETCGCPNVAKLFQVRYVIRLITPTDTMGWDCKPQGGQMREPTNRCFQLFC